MANGIKTWIVDTTKSAVESVRNLSEGTSPSATEHNAADATMSPELLGAVQNMLAKNASTGTNSLSLFMEEPSAEWVKSMDRLRKIQYIGVGTTIACAAVLLGLLVRDYPNVRRNYSDWRINRMLADPRMVALREVLSRKLNPGSLDRVQRSVAPKILKDVKTGMDFNRAIQKHLPDAIVAEISHQKSEGPYYNSDSYMKRLLHMEKNISRVVVRSDAVERAGDATVDPKKGKSAERARKVGGDISGKKPVVEERDSKRSSKPASKSTKGRAR